MGGRGHKFSGLDSNGIIKAIEIEGKRSEVKNYYSHKAGSTKEKQLTLVLLCIGNFKVGFNYCAAWRMEVSFNSHHLRPVLK